jgi:succinyl-diaminopimelate desuccinylase
VSLLEDTLELVRIDSISRNESVLATLIAERLADAAHLEVERVGDNVVAATRGHHRQRVIVAGHLDTVPGDPTIATIDRERLIGLGACDMKGSLAVMLRLATQPTPGFSEVTWVFYAREEISRRESGLVELFELRPDLVQGDVAILAEPTGGCVEGGCQGTLRLALTVAGARAHTARPYTGRNAIHRLGEIIRRIALYEPRRVIVDGLEFTEQVQVVDVSGGVAPNVVPDVARIVLNHRVAPDRQLDEAVAGVEDLVADLLEDGDRMDVLDWAPSATPSLHNALVGRLIQVSGQAPRAKVGWTDVATFVERGVPAANFGAGDPLLAHRSEEFVTLAELESFEASLRSFLSTTA